MTELNMKNKKHRILNKSSIKIEIDNSQRIKGIRGKK